MRVVIVIAVGIVVVAVVVQVFIAAWSPVARKTALIRTWAFTPPLGGVGREWCWLKRLMSGVLWLPFAGLMFNNRICDANASLSRGDLRFEGGVVATLEGAGTHPVLVGRRRMALVGRAALVSGLTASLIATFEVMGPWVLLLLVWLLWPLVYSVCVEPRVGVSTGWPRPVGVLGPTTQPVVMSGFAKANGAPAGAVVTLEKWLKPYGGRCVGIARCAVIVGVYHRLTPKPVEIPATGRFGEKWARIEW